MEPAMIACSNCNGTGYLWPPTHRFLYNFEGIDKRFKDCRYYAADQCRKCGATGRVPVKDGPTVTDGRGPPSKGCDMCHKVTPDNKYHLLARADGDWKMLCRECHELGHQVNRMLGEAYNAPKNPNHQ
jgi:RecJ-like exonuclease